MAITKKPCINDSTFTFTGKESSPTGLGYCPNPEKVGTFMKGKDGTMWMVGMKNGVKVWNRVPTELANEVNAPLKKDEPVMNEDETDEPKQDVAKPKKTTKKVTKKKDVPANNDDEAGPSNVDGDAPRISDDDSNKEVKTDNDDKVVKPKKKVTKKKVPVANAAENAEVPNANAEVPNANAELPNANAEVPNANAEVPNEEAPVQEDVPKPKKKVVRKKKDADAPASESGQEEKKKRKPTDFNLFVKYRMKYITDAKDHKDKFSRAASEWRELSADAKKEIMEKVHAEFGTN